jgi:hypothetical protein
MNVNLQIDRLILEGIDLSPSQRRYLQTVVEAELSQLFTVNGVPDHWQTGGAIAGLPAGKLEVTNSATPAAMGQQIAQQIYGRLAQSE